MNSLSRLLIGSLALLVSFMATSISHAGEKKVGDYIIYYNAFNSSFLQPSVAKSYKIPRSGFTGVINVSVHKDNSDHTSTALSANVQGKAKNNLSQYADLAFREIKEDKAIYYLSDFQFRNKENMNLQITIRIPGHEQPVTLNFNQKFYAD